MLYKEVKSNKELEDEFSSGIAYEDVFLSLT